ncbi:hypothetical protein LLG96_00445 [bacterium]|nr:hypothetical protein [bacterium]
MGFYNRRSCIIYYTLLSSIVLCGCSIRQYVFTSDPPGATIYSKVTHSGGDDYPKSTNKKTPCTIEHKFFLGMPWEVWAFQAVKGSDYKDSEYIYELDIKPNNIGERKYHFVLEPNSKTPNSKSSPVEISKKINSRANQRKIEDKKVTIPSRNNDTTLGSSDNSLASISSGMWKDISWNSNISNLQGFNQTNSSQDGNLKTYVRLNDELKLGEIPLESITYDFWKGRFFRVTLMPRDRKGRTVEELLIKLFGDYYTPPYNRGISGYNATCYWGFGDLIIEHEYGSDVIDINASKLDYIPWSGYISIYSKTIADEMGFEYPDKFK